MTAPTRHHAVIVGGGLSGIGMAATLRRAGIDDYVLLERGDGLGGTWHHNTYPGCGCDIPSALYSFAFRPNPDWSCMFASREEIRDYLLDVAREHDVPRHARLGVEMRSAAWDDAARVWRVETSAGPLEATWLFLGTGSLHAANMVDIPGVEAFRGRVFHSSSWPAGYTGAGERVAVIGTGASSIQLTPKLVDAGAEVTLFQRTPAWIQPKPNLRHGPWQRALFRRFPATQRALRALEWGFGELFLAGAFRPWLGRVLERIPRAWLRYRVRDAGLRAKLTPSYAMGCKRLLVDNAFYGAVQRPNLELVDSGVVRIGARSVTAADGTAREVDTIVYATGFHYGVGPSSGLVRGRDGRTLAEVWDGSPQAYLGTSVSGFPNLVLLWGPNTGTTSIAVSVEAQLNHVAAMLAHMRETGVDVLDVRPEHERAFRDLVVARTRTAVHAVGGCTSFYLDAKGKNLLLWPGSMLGMWRRMRRFDPAPYAPVPAANPLPEKETA
jgi:cation diffusion facilitator CzcD-associated flavoprotein CzcO